MASRFDMVPPEEAYPHDVFGYPRSDDNGELYVYIEKVKTLIPFIKKLRYHYHAKFIHIYY